MPVFHDVVAINRKGLCVVEPETFANSEMNGKNEKPATRSSVSGISNYVARALPVMEGTVESKGGGGGSFQLKYKSVR